MKVYLVYGDVYFDPDGSDIRCFGIFYTKQIAEQVRLQKENEFYQQELKKKKYRRIDSREDIKFEVMELEINKTTDLELGGYTE